MMDDVRTQDSGLRRRQRLSILLLLPTNLLQRLLRRLGSSIGSSIGFSIRSSIGSSIGSCDLPGRPLRFSQRELRDSGLGLGVGVRSEAARVAEGKAQNKKIVRRKCCGEVNPSLRLVRNTGARVSIVRDSVQPTICSVKFLSHGDSLSLTTATSPHNNSHNILF